MRTSKPSVDDSRRRLIGWMLASPLLAALPRAVAEELANTLITDPSQALDVMDFEAVARSVLPPAHFAYLSTGVDDEATLKANREGFKRYGIRSRRLVDISKTDASVTVLGEKWASPIFICPTGSQRACHPPPESEFRRVSGKRRPLRATSRAGA